MTIITAYYDRDVNSIAGVFTLQQNDGHTTRKLFDRLPARSGQRGYTHSSWVRGKSPIPFGVHRLWLQSNNPGAWAGKTGIGEFFPISNGTNRRIIEDKQPRPASQKDPNIRMDIGLHPENGFPGSAGCIVLLADTPERKREVSELFRYLRDLGKSRDHIKLVVL